MLDLQIFYSKILFRKSKIMLGGSARVESVFDVSKANIKRDNG